MSRASEYAKAVSEREELRDKIRSSAKHKAIFIPGDFRVSGCELGCSVNDRGEMTLYQANRAWAVGEDREIVSGSLVTGAKDALALAAWINETFGEHEPKFSLAEGTP